MEPEGRRRAGGMAWGSTGHGAGGGGIAGSRPPDLYAESLNPSFLPQNCLLNYQSLTPASFAILTNSGSSCKASSKLSISCLM